MVLRPSVEYLRQYLAQRTSNKILYDIRKKLYGHLQMLSAKFYANNKVGRLSPGSLMMLSRLRILSDRTDECLVGPVTIIALVIMFNLDVQLTLASIVIFLIYILEFGSSCNREEN